MRGLIYPLTSLRDLYQTRPFFFFTCALKGVFFGHMIFQHVFEVGSSWGPSMLPTFSVMGDWMLVSKYYRRGKGVEVGDIVQFRSVVEPGQRVVKRVVGLEGDYVLRDTPGQGERMMLQVPQGHCWVVGDNFSASRDSRHFGPMPMALIKGKVIAKVLPWSEAKWFGSQLNPVE